MSKQRLLAVHYWIPELWERKGGIQNYVDNLVGALRQSLPEAKHVLQLKNDKVVSKDFSQDPSVKVNCTGWAPLWIRTPIFAATLFVRALFCRPSLILVCHVHFSPVAMLLKKLTGQRYWIVIYGVEAWNLKNEKQRSACEMADKIVSISQFSKVRLLDQISKSEADIVLLPCTVDLDKFRVGERPEYLLERYSFTHSQPVMLTVGRLESSEQFKAYEQVLEALPMIQAEIPDIQYLIVGDGDYKQELSKKISERGLENVVTLAGYVSDTELADHYNLCSLFALPSKLEGFGIVFLEALACGKPVLGGNQDGAVEALAEGELGILVDPDDIDELAREVIALLQNKHPNKHVYDRESLRSGVRRRFGKESYLKRLQEQLRRFN